MNHSSSGATGVIYTQEGAFDLTLESLRNIFPGDKNALLENSPEVFEFFSVFSL